MFERQQGGDRHGKAGRASGDEPGSQTGTPGAPDGPPAGVVRHAFVERRVRRKRRDPGRLRRGDSGGAPRTAPHEVGEPNQRRNLLDGRRSRCSPAGVGAALVEAAAAEATRRGVKYLFVATLHPDDPYEPYQRTRRFYEALGFAYVLEEQFPADPENPLAYYLRELSASHWGGSNGLSLARRDCPWPLALGVEVRPQRQLGEGPLPGAAQTQLARSGPNPGAAATSAFDPWRTYGMSAWGRPQLHQVRPLASSDKG